MAIPWDGWWHDELCEHLRPVVELELKLGNTIKRVDAPAGTRCPLAVVFVKPLHRSEIDRGVAPAEPVIWHESSDPHYEIGGTAGYFCEEVRHFVYGPVATYRR